MFHVLPNLLHFNNLNMLGAYLVYLFIKIMSTEKVYYLANYVEKHGIYERVNCLFIIYSLLLFNPVCLG